MLIGAPYDCGRRGWRMGRGPLELLGGREGVAWAEIAEDERPELARTFAVNARLAELVAEAPGLPVVVAGNCNACLAQAGRADSIVWLDAHGDFHLPETTGSGFFDGMALSIATGEGWDALAATIPGFAPVPPERVVMVGVRDLDPAEEERIAARGVRRATAAEAEPPGEHVYLHIDLDVLDVSVGRANAFACPGGLTTDELVSLVARLRPRLCGATLASWDPAFDEGGGVRAAAEAALAVLAFPNA